MNAHAPIANDLLSHAESFLKSLNSGPVAVAVSGGSDSVAALRLIHEASGSDRQIICLTVNHGLRNEAVLEAKFVAEICKSLGIEHQTLNWQGVKPKTGLQQAAREARYHLLAESCAQFGVVGLITGHTLDDQLETVAMRAARSSEENSRGLSGMSEATLFQKQMWVLRPFLKFNRQQLRQYLQANNQTWVDDPSNENLAFERVRVRKEADFSVTYADLEAAQTTRVQNSAAVANYLDANCTVQDGLIAHLHIRNQNLETALSALEVLISIIGGRKRSLSRDQLDELRKLIDSSQHQRVTIGRAIVELKNNQVSLMREHRDLEEIRIKPHTSSVWDRRFLITNNDPDRELFVGADTKTKGLPPSFSWDRPLDDLLFLDSAEDEQFYGLVSVQRYFNKMDEVLPSFDLPIAKSAARLFGSEPFPDKPFGD